MKLRGKHIFAVILFLIGIAFTIYVTMPDQHKDHSGFACPVEKKSVKDTTKNGPSN